MLAGCKNMEYDSAAGSCEMIGQGKSLLTRLERKRPGQQFLALTGVGYLLDFIDLVEEDFDGIEYFFWIFQLRQMFRA